MVVKNIVLLHGWGASIKKLKPLETELKNLDWDVLTPKLPGFDTDPPKEAWGVSEYANYVSKMINSPAGRQGDNFKNGKYFVFGHSFGGRIVIKMAAENDSKLQGAIFCAAGGISRGSLIKRALFYPVAKIFKPISKTLRIYELGRKVLYKAAREHDYKKAEGVMKDVFKKVVSEDLKPFLSKIKLPTLILWGEDDKVTPIADAHLINQKVAKSKLVSFKDEGHTLPYEKPKELAEKIDKWAQSL